jgi:Periplasmic copper-binding protein (NosD).
MGIFLEGSGTIIADSIISNNGKFGIFGSFSDYTQCLRNRIDNNFRGVLLSNYSTIAENVFSNNMNETIYITNSRFVTIDSNTFQGNGMSAWIWKSNSSVFSGNTVEGDAKGIAFYKCLDSLIADNQFVGHPGNESGTGISMGSGSQNTIYNNTIVGFSKGLEVFGSSSSIIQNNHVYGNLLGTHLSSLDTFLIFNNMLNNTQNIQLMGTNKGIRWNTTPSKESSSIVGGCAQGGNYWANVEATGFSQTCQDTNYDGFCDAIYSVASDQVDHFPLHDSLKGDLTGNGIVEWGDVVRIAYMSWGLTEGSPCADFNGSGSVDWGDVVQLAYYYWRLIPEL